MSTVLSVTAARKRYGQTQALDGAAMSLNQGEWLALLGPNGAGKTTLIRAIAGRVRLDDGAITLLDQRLNGDPQQARSARARLGVVPQEIALYPLLSARENLRAFGELQGVNSPALNDRIEWALQWTGLAERADDLTKTFSGGMKRRLNIACGVLHRPEVVLLDEPTAQLDVRGEAEIFDRILAASRHCTTILISHRFSTVRHADRICVLEHGKVIELGTHDELMAKAGRYRTMFDLQAQRFTATEDEEGKTYDVLA